MHIEKFTSSIERYCQWIERHRHPSGRWKENSSSSAYFSLIPFANHIGRRDWALAGLRTVQERMIDDQGLLVQGPDRDDYIGYVPSWFVWGSIENGSLTLAHQLANFVQSLQCNVTGGIFGSLASSKQGHGMISFDATAMAAVAFARAGRIEECVRVGDFFLTMIDAQLNVDVAFYTDWQQPGGLIRDKPAANSVLEWALPKQHYYKMGLLAVALCEVYRASADRRYLDAAINSYRLTADRAVDLYTNTLSHKMCWAAFRLFSETYDSKYAAQAGLYADHLVSLQQPDGAFSYPELWTVYPPAQWKSLPNCGCQFALWIAMARDALRVSADA